MADAHPGHYAKLTVADSGCGIPVEIKGKIFDPFFTTKEVGKGTGLGLSTVLGIVRSHSGFVTVESEMARGATFNVFLPADTDNAVGQQALQHVETPLNRGCTILIIDDEVSILDAISLVLVKNEYQVLRANDGAAGLDLFRKHADRISVVLVDVIMPGMDGVQIAQALKAINPQVKIIASTGHADETMESKLEALGVGFILRKPYDTGKLLSSLHEMISGS